MAKIKDTVEIEEQAEVTQQTEEYEDIELVANAMRLFGYNADITGAALAIAHVKSCTIEDARRIVTEFARKKV